MPISPDPGTTSVSSSLNTLVAGLEVNLAVSVLTPRIVIWLPIDPSLEPIASNKIACGIRSSSSSFTSVVHITPEETIIFNVDVSYGSPRSIAARRARMIGLENESPTIVLWVTP